MKINNHVYLNAPDGRSVCLPPGEVPEWAVPLITNKALIVQEAPELPKPSPSKPEDESKGDPEKGDGDDLSQGSSEGDGDGEGDEQKAEELPIPPKGGRGGSAEAWAKYAASKGFEVEGDAKASDIREALEAEGIPTE